MREQRAESGERRAESKEQEAFSIEYMARGMAEKVCKYSGMRVFNYQG